jgi:hypothetical protein
LVAVAPALQVLVGIVGACWLGALEIRVVEDFLGVCGREAGDDHVAAAICLVFFVCHGSSYFFRVKLVQCKEVNVTSRVGMVEKQVRIRKKRGTIVEKSAALTYPKIKTCSRNLSAHD